MRPYLIMILLLMAIGVGVPFLNETGSPAVTPASAEDDPYAPRSVTLRADDLGHFTVEAFVNGRVVEMLADTGATAVLLTESDARRAGFNPGSLDYSVTAATANGTTRVAPVSIDRIEVDGIVVRDIAGLVARPETLHRSLLGMSFIGRLGRFSLERDRLVLVE